MAAISDWCNWIVAFEAVDQGLTGKGLPPGRPPLSGPWLPLLVTSRVHLTATGYHEG